jgi:hypothetical protein
VKSSEDEIEELNRDQLWQGTKSDRTKIIPPYAPSTIRRKKKKGQPYNRVTLKDTGQFYASIQAFVDQSGINISSTDFKTKFLKGRYGKEILGLSFPSIEILIDLIKPDVIFKTCLTFERS